jgi:subtilase family serine protease
MFRAPVSRSRAFALSLLIYLISASRPAFGDGNPPVLSGTPTVDPASVDVTDEDQKVRVEAVLSDADGVSFVYFTFTHPGSDTVLASSSANRLPNTPANLGTWVADVEIERTVAGVLHLHVECWDEADNYVDIVTNVAVTVIGGDDVDPSLNGTVTIDPGTVDLSSGAVDVTIAIPLRDAGSGIQSVDIFFASGDTLYISGAQAKLLSGDSHEGVWGNIISIPDNAVAGVYDLVVDVSDFAGNDDRLYIPSLTVGGGDSEPPALTGEISIEPLTLHLDTDDAPVTVRVSLADPSGVNFTSTEIRDSTGTGVAFDFARLDMGDSLSGTWETGLVIPGATLAGQYTVLVYAVDRLSNGTDYVAAKRLTITRGDMGAPTVATPVFVEPDTVDTAPGGRLVTVRAHVRDDSSGVASVMALFVKAGALSLDDSLSLVEGDDRDGVWSGDVLIPPDAAPGVYNLVLFVRDRTGNTADRPSGSTLLVRRPDADPPVLAGIATLDPASVDVSSGAKTAELLFGLADAGTGVDTAWVDLRPIGGGPSLIAAAERISGDSFSGGWRAVIDIPADTPAGVLSIRIVAFDGLGNLAEIPVDLELHVIRNLEASVRFRVDMRPFARLGLFRPELGMQITLDLFDAPNPRIVPMSDGNADSVYDAEILIPADTPVRYAFALDPESGDSASAIRELDGGARELQVNSATPVILPTVPFDNLGLDGLNLAHAARVTRSLGSFFPDSLFNDGPVYTDLQLRQVSATRGLVAVRRYPGSPGGALPAGIAVLSSAVYWGVSTLTDSLPVPGALLFDWRLYGGVADPTALRWLYRPAAGSPWVVVPSVPDPVTHTLRAAVTPIEGEWVLGSTSAANTLLPEPPDAPSEPNPPDDSIRSDGDRLFAWLGSEGALSYDAWLWPEGEAQPQEPLFRGLEDPEFASFEAFPFLSSWSWQVAAQNRAGATSGPVWSFRVDRLPDLEVVDIQSPPEAFAGQAIEIEWTVTNRGNNATSVAEWYDYVVFSPDADLDLRRDTYLGAARNPAYLRPGESYRSVKEVVIPATLPGDGYLYVVTNPDIRMVETSRTNNTRSTSLLVRPALQSDLATSSLVAPDRIFSGKPIRVSWKVTNDGPGRFVDKKPPLNALADILYLSADTLFDAQADRYLSGAPGAEILQPESSYTTSIQFLLPDSLYGDFHLFVVADGLNLFPEIDDVANNRSRRPITITLTPPPDLVATEVSAPQSLSSGRTVRVAWQVANMGPGTVPGKSWSDRLLLVPEPGASTDSIYVLGTFARGGFFGPDSAYADTAVVSLPNGIHGPFHFRVVTDWDNRVFEYIYDHNNSADGPSIPLSLSPWPNLAPLLLEWPANAEAGSQIELRWRTSNTGTDTVRSGWTDRVYLCPSATWDSIAAIPVGAATHQTDLAPGADAASFTVGRLPVVAAGPWHLFAVADQGEEIYEHLDEADNVSPGVPIALSALPVDLRVDNLTAPSNALSGRTIAVEWRVVNTGAGRSGVSEWDDLVYLSTDPVLDASDRSLGTFPRNGELPGGGDYMRSVVIRLPNGLSGRFHLLVVTDGAEEVPEGNDANNITASTPLDIVLPPPADLRVDGLLAPNPAPAGQPLAIDFTVRNAGTGSTFDSTWYQSAWLSKNAIVDGSDVLLGTFRHIGALDAGTSRAVRMTPAVPAWVAGNYYLIVQADSRDDVYEHGNETNNIAAQLVTFDLPAPVDLVVSAITIDPEANAGDSVTVSWTLHNPGTYHARGEITDAVYVSPDSAWNLLDPLVGALTHSIDLPAGASMKVQSRVSLARPILADVTGDLREPLPGLAPGLYHALVRTNIRATLREIDLDNNTGVSEAPVNVTVPLLPFDTPTPARVVEGGAVYYRIEVPEAGVTMTIELDGAGSSASRELYVRFAEPAGRSRYDHGGRQPFSPDQDILVPAAEQGTHYLMAFGDRVPAGEETVTLTARILTFGVDAITPDRGGQGGRVTLAITGSAIEDNIQPVLVRGATRLQPERILWIDPASVFATFDLENAQLGEYDMELEQVRRRYLYPGDPIVTYIIEADTNRTVVTGAFTVEPPRVRPTDIRVSVPPVVRVQQSFEMAVEATNTSNTDIRAPLVMIFGTPDFPKAAGRPGTLLGGARLFLVTSDTGPAGVLAPGATGRVGLGGLALPNPGLMNVHVLPVEDKSRPFDLDRLLLENGVDPASPVWSEAVGALRARGISTWSDYADMLAETATNRGRRVTVPQEADDLLMLTLEAELNHILHPDAVPDSLSPAEGVSLAAEWYEASAALPPAPNGGTVVPQSSPQGGGEPDCSATAIAGGQAAGASAAAGFAHTSSYVASAHMTNYLTSGADIRYPNGSSVSEAARTVKGQVSFSQVHDEESQALRGVIESYVKSHGCSGLRFPKEGYSRSVRPLDFYPIGRSGAVTVFDSRHRDLILAFGGMRRGYVSIKDLEITAWETRDCEHDCDRKLCHVAYKGVLIYTFGDDYEYSREDCGSSSFESRLCNLQKCGRARPFRTEIVIEAPVSGRFVVGEGSSFAPETILLSSLQPGLSPYQSQSGTHCDPGDRDDDPSPINVVGAVDPNDIIGPTGAGDGRWVARTDLLPYRIRFENDPKKANAPAQVVTISQTLDPDVDRRSFRLGRFGFGSFVFQPPANVSYYTDRLDVRDSLGVLVDVTAGIDITSGEAFWEFRSLDSNGEVPANPFAGFLPVNDDAGHGSGFVSYTVHAVPEASTGDRIDAEASIVFDQNPPLATPAIFNTLDADAPRSRVRTLPSLLDTTRIDLAWDGGDSTGSGVASYQVFMAEDEGAFAMIEDGIEGTSLGVDGRFGHAYRFFVRAVDRTGIPETEKTAAEATVRLEPGGGSPTGRPFAVHPNYPNPFRTSTTISFDLPAPGRVHFRVFDIAGRLVQLTASRPMGAGPQTETLRLEGRSSGIYFVEVCYRNAAGGEATRSRRVVYLR